MRQLLLLGAMVPSLLAARPAAGKSFLWRVKGPHATSYVLGSIHMARKSLYPLAPAINRAFKRCKVLVLEARPDNASAALSLVQRHGVYQPPDKLAKHLSAKTLALVKARLRGTPLSLGMVQRFKPWLLAITLTQLDLKALGFKPHLGIDNHFLSRAKAARWKIAVLEGIAYQLKLFAGMSDSDQELFLLYTMKQSKLLRSTMNKLVARWKAGDHRGLNKLMNESLRKVPRFRPMYKKLVVDRNVKMARKIVRMVKSRQPHFIIVGAAHLAGRRSIVALLRRAGLKPVQL